MDTEAVLRTRLANIQTQIADTESLIESANQDLDELLRDKLAVARLLAEAGQGAPGGAATGRPMRLVILGTDWTHVDLGGTFQVESETKAKVGDDWTSSDEYLRMVDAVYEIVSNCRVVDDPRVAARSIVSALAHKHGMRPGVGSEK
jgi:hypothetical protein